MIQTKGERKRTNSRFLKAPRTAAAFEEFDALSDIHEDDVERGAYDNRRRINRRKVKKKRTTVSKEASGKSRKDVCEALYDILLSRRARHLGVPIFCVALMMSMMLELVDRLPNYNTVVIVVLAASMEFKYFPPKAVRPQLVISLVALGSLAADVYVLSTSSRFIVARPLVMTGFVLLMFSKLLLLWSYLRNVQSASRTRKYLNRRFRLLYPPLYQPRRIMRDVRARMLIVGWIQLASVVIYLLLSGTMMLVLDYAAFVLTPESTDDAISAIPWFLLLKAGSSLFLLFGILYDTDVVLCLWYFGCFGCCGAEYVRSYIRRKRIELKGFPLAFSYSSIRFYILSFFKVLDVGWGIYGWTLLSGSLGHRFVSMESHLKVFVLTVAMTIVFSDYYVSILLLGVRWLVRRRNILREIGRLEDSDDSEIEEFGLRTDLQIEADLQKRNEIRRLRYQMRSQEEQLRVAELTALPVEQTSLMRSWLTDGMHFSNKSKQKRSYRQSAAAGIVLPIDEVDTGASTAKDQESQFIASEGSVYNGEYFPQSNPLHERDIHVEGMEDMENSLYWDRIGTTRGDEVIRRPDNIVHSTTDQTNGSSSSDDDSKVTDPLIDRTVRLTFASGYRLEQLRSKHLQQEFVMEAADFALRWEACHDRAVASMAEVIINNPYNAPLEMLQPKTTLQQVVNLLVEFIQCSGYKVTAAGIDSSEMIKLYCYGAMNNRRNSSSGASEVVGMIELKLRSKSFGSAASHRSTVYIARTRFLLEVTCRCDEIKLCQLFLDQLQLRVFFAFTQKEKETIQKHMARLLPT